ncbi:hypothetical protein AGMMS49574_18700 [Bacteroidia bacterium]|nr:hypothetical protein AGMMS49574_18700 [Bacteroidia bacterium]
MIVIVIILIVGIVVFVVVKSQKKPQKRKPEPSTKSEYDMMVFDCETTGLLKRHTPTYIIQLSWMLLDSSYNTIREENFYLKPPVSIPEFITAINQITNDMVIKNATLSRVVMKKFHADRKQTKTLIAHNYEFDSELIDSETYRVRLHEDNIKYKDHICTMRAGTNFCKLPGIYDTYKYPKLEELAEACGIPIPEGSRDSVSGCRITAKCAKYLADNGYLCNEWNS